MSWTARALLPAVYVWIRRVIQVGAQTWNVAQDRCSELSPIVSKPCTAMIPEPTMLVHSSFHGLSNVLEDYSVYLVWAGGANLALVEEKVFWARGPVSLWGGTRGHRVWGQAWLLRPLACSAISEDITSFPLVSDYRTLWHRFTKSWCHWCEQENRDRIFQTFSYSGTNFASWLIDSGLRNAVVIWLVKLIRISCSRAHYPAHSYLIPPWGAHKSITLKEVVHSMQNRPPIFL